MKRSFVVLLALWASFAPALAAPAAPAALKTDVKLAVIVSVDGLGWARLSGYRPWFTGGLKRLLDEGQVEADCHYAHLNTETGPGHASLGTGAPPRVTGIVANRWYEAAGAGVPLKRLYCTDQPDFNRPPGQPPFFYREVEKDERLFVFAQKKSLEIWQATGDMGKSTNRIGAGPDGKTLVFDSDDAITLYDFRHGLPVEDLPAAGNVAGPFNLRVPTLADRLVEASPASRVVSLSGKDRGAIFLAGKSPRHVVYWYDKETGRFFSSSAYDSDGILGGTARDLVRRFNRDQAGGLLVSRFGTLWHRLPDPDGPGAGALPQPAPDLADFQVPTWGLGFDHDLARDPGGYFAGFYTSPLQDQLLTDLALAVLDSPLQLGRRGVPDILALSYSAHDVVSHNYGNESAEELDTLRRLDRELGRLLAALDTLERDGSAPGHVVLALSADHGFTPLPEVVRRTEGRIGGRLIASDRSYPSFVERLNRLLADELCLPPGGPWISGGDGWALYYERGNLPAATVEGACGPAGKPVTADDFDRVLPKVVAHDFDEEIDHVLLMSQRGSWPAADPAVGFANNDFDAVRSGDAFLIPREYVLMHWDPARGSGHGSLYEYDTHVPLIFWGAPFPAGERGTPSAPYDLAPTLGAALGVSVPDATGHSRLEGRAKQAKP